MNAKIKKQIQIILTAITYIVLFVGGLYVAGRYAVTKYGFDTDLLWHLKIGRDILEKKEIFLDNTYSWISGTTWSQQEWLFDVIVYGITSVFGIVGFYAMHIISQLSLLGISIKKHKYHFTLISIVLFLLIYMNLPFNSVNRPAEYSTYFFVLMMYLYDKQFKLKPLVYFASGIFLANFHCGSVVALIVLMGIMFASDIILNFIFLKTNKKPITMSWKFALQYIASCGLFFVGLCINPYGFKQITEMFNVMHLSSTQYINEWRPYSSDNYLVWIMLFAIAYSFGYALNKHKWNKTDTIRIIIMSSVLVLSLSSRKAFIMFFYLFIAFGYKYFDEMLYDFVQKTNLVEIIKVKTKGLLKIIPPSQSMWKTLFVLCGIFAIGVASYNQKSMDNLINSVRNEYVSEGAMAFLKQAAADTDDFRLLNGYVTGNYLLYYNVPCFIDSRQIPYAKEVGDTTAVDDYFDTNSHNLSDMDAFFDKYKFNYVLSNEEYGINWYLEQRGTLWNLVYSDDEDNYIWEYMGS